MWQTEFHIDALRLDAVHAIKDASAYPFLAELADSSARIAGELGRPFYLIAESNLNDARLVKTKDAGGFGLNAMWSDDYHHALHALLTGERDGYYQDFGRLEDLAEAYRSGFTLQGQYSRYRNRRHGNSPAGLAPCRFVVFARITTRLATGGAGERLSTLLDWESLKLAVGLVLLSPYVPLLFMGEEYGEKAPFLYFVSHGDSRLSRPCVRGGGGNLPALRGRGKWPTRRRSRRSSDRSWTSRLQPRAAERSCTRFTAALLGLRKAIPGLGCQGSLPAQVTVDSQNQLLDVLRCDEGSTVRLLFHLADAPGEYDAAWPTGAGLD